MQKVIHGDCLEVLRRATPNSIDSIITDPPYELGFMGKSWDSTGIANNVELWKECLRVLKPGGHLLAFSGTRTYHRMASAIEDAGFEVRDMIEWVYGSGFPKSLDVAKAIEGKLVLGSSNVRDIKKLDGVKTEVNDGMNKSGEEQGYRDKVYVKTKTDVNFTTVEAIQWKGWGTALKPAHEPICMARKPLAEKTVAENCLKWGTGGINIDESRVEYKGKEDFENTLKSNTGNIAGGIFKCSSKSMAKEEVITSSGRFPANLIHDNSEEVRECFPETKSGGGLTKRKNEDAMFDFGRGYEREEISDSGNASRFFKSIIYQAKASKSDRGEGNTHATVKPTALMEYLIKMVTPKGGIVLDPFAGSGSTLVAAKQNGYQYVGIEMTEEYIPIIKARLGE